MLHGRFHSLVYFCLAGYAAAQTAYDFGDPDGSEQVYIERINRARATPTEEGIRLATTTHPEILAAYAGYSVNLTMMKAELAAIAAKPPLVPNAKLMSAARGHSNWMFTNAQQAHDQPDGTSYIPTNGKTFIERIEAESYNYQQVGENVFAFAADDEDAHAGFEVDWGPGGTGGMQAGRGHRANIHSSTYRELGIGAVKGTNTKNGTTVGPEIITQDFGVQQNSPTFGTGVAYYDLDADNFYDNGEGIAGLRVDVGGQTTYYCTTAKGGGWVVPVPTAAATRAVTFSGLGINQSVNLVVPASTNAKADLKLAYTAPSITSVAQAVTGSPHTFTFAPGVTGGVTGYRLTRRDKAAAATENCENTTNVTPSISGGYSLVNSNIKDGTTGASFHLANPNGTTHGLELKPLYYGGSSPTMSFKSWVRTSTSDEKFKVQVKEEGSSVWVDAYSQTGGVVDSGFVLRSPAISGMAGKFFRVRYQLQFSSGSYTGGNADTYGWFIDTISFTNVSQVGSPVTQDFTGTSTTFTPTVPGEQLLLVQPIISNRAFPGAVQTLAVKSPATITLGGLAQTYTGTARVATATTSPAGKTVTFTYDGSATAPTNAGSYAVVATINDANYSGSASGTLVVSKAAATVTLGSLAQTYTGTARTATATTNPAGKTVAITYNGSASAPINAGSYAVVATINDANYSGSASGTLVVAKAAATVTLGGLAQTYTGTARTVTATTSPAGKTVTFTYNGSASAPINAGSYAVVATINDANYSGTASGTLVVAKAAATVTLGGLAQTYTGTARSATATTSPAGKTVTFTYNGSASAPINAGSYTVVGTITDANYAGSATGTMVISAAASPTYATWAVQAESSASLPLGSIRDNPHGDTDNDGLSNLMEYAFGTWPVQRDTSPEVFPNSQIALRNNVKCLVLRYQRDKSRNDVTLVPIACPTMTNWKSPGASGAPAGFVDSVVSTTGDIETREAILPISGSPSCFLRLRAVLP